MATSIITDCSSIHGSTTSSSSDMLTVTTAASSWCAIPTCTRIRIVRLMRPHARRMLVTPGTTPSYGFAVRGGKEYSTGFFVSNVDRNSEAEQKGLRIGDQILRINGFRIDDATHKEFCQLVTSQDRLVLKVRSVGMMPTKDKENDGLSWSVVKTPSISTTASECSYQSSLTERCGRNQNERVVNVVLNVAPRTKLGLGICKGPEWKPGIFVQFTKEKSVAREAGLRPGDQILTVNSIDFSDVLFSEAVAVMKSSNKLDMTVHKAAGCDLFPGESSGYNSSASSVTGDQSPCWGDIKSKRLTAVREESSANGGKSNIWNQSIYENEPRLRSKSNLERHTKPAAENASKSSKDINKTIIKLSESGTSINNTYVANSGTQSHGTDTMRRISNAKENCNNNQATFTKTVHPIAKSPSNIPPPVPPPLQMANGHGMSQSLKNSSNSHASAVEGPIKLGGMAATMQRYANLSTYAIDEGSAASPGREAVRETSCSQQPGIDNSSLSSAITEELKKRKAKRQPSLNCQPSLRVDASTNSHLATALAVANEPKCLKANGGPMGDQHSALMNEFKQAHKRMFKNGFKESEPMEHNDRQEALMRTTMMDDPTTYRAQGCRQSKCDALDGGNKNATRPEDKTTADNASAAMQSAIPKPPPMQLNGLMEHKTSSHHDHAPASFRPRNGSINGCSMDGNGGNDLALRNHNRISTPAGPASGNRQTLRPGSVTIGEYRNHNSRREPEKFDFIAASNKRNDSGETTPTNESLQSELQSTLSRSRLKKSNSGQMEHQRNCPLNQTQQQQQQQQQQMQSTMQQRPGQAHHHHHHHHQQQQQQHHSNSHSPSAYEYQNMNYNNNNSNSTNQPTYSVSDLSKKLQKSSLANGEGTTTNGRHHSNGSVSVGILKNGNRNSGASKTSEKSIKFG